MQNITELRDSLLDNYQKTKEKKMTINLSKELSNSAGKILNSLRVELDYNKQMDNGKEIQFLKIK